MGKLAEKVLEYLGSKPKGLDGLDLSFEQIGKTHSKILGSNINQDRLPQSLQNNANVNSKYIRLEIIGMDFIHIEEEYISDTSSLPTASANGEQIFQNTLTYSHIW